MEPDLAERLHHVICARHSTRAPFDPRWHVGPHELDAIVAAARWAPTPHNMQNFALIVVQDPALLRELGSLHAPVSPVFVAETAPLLSRSQEELEHRQTGLLAAQFAGSGSSRPLAELIAGAPLLLVVIYDASQRAPASENDVLGMIGLGCVLENMWLTAHALHLDAQVVSSFSGESVEPSVKQLLAIPDTWRIAYVLRLGHAVTAASGQRVRRDLQRFVHHDHFGEP
jgi:nitroreductase